MRCILVILASVLSAMTVNAGEQSRNAYDFSFKTISGEPLPFSEFRGKLVMVVNTASECGFKQCGLDIATKDLSYLVYLPMTSVTKNLAMRLKLRAFVK